MDELARLSHFCCRIQASLRPIPVRIIARGLAFEDVVCFLNLGGDLADCHAKAEEVRHELLNASGSPTSLNRGL